MWKAESERDKNGRCYSPFGIGTIGEGTRGKEKGFTLLETLVVFSASLLLLSLLPPLFSSVRDTIEQKNFLHLFEEDLYLAQQTAITKKIPVSFHYLASLKRYEFRLSSGDILLTRKLPEKIEIRRGHMNEFRFLANGNVNRFGNMYILMDGKVYRAYFSIGRGRFEIYDEEG